MHHSPESVNGRYLGRSTSAFSGVRGTSGSNMPMTCDVITRLRLGAR
jgi:hypothetical protein